MRLVGAHHLIPAGLITQLVVGEAEKNLVQLVVGGVPGEVDVGTPSEPDRGIQNNFSTIALEN